MIDRCVGYDEMIEGAVATIGRAAKLLPRETAEAGARDGHEYVSTDQRRSAILGLPYEM